MKAEVESRQVPASHVPIHGVTFREAIGVWIRVAALSFGGPAGQIAIMHRILVEEKKWIGENRFLHALNYCMLLPGPEAQQLAIYIGWLLHKTRGGLVAGSLFVLPGLIAIMILSWIYAAFGTVGVVTALFFGLKAAVLAVVLEAVVRVGKRALKNRVMIALAAAAFIALFFFGVPFPLVILAAALIGFVGGRLGMGAFLVNGGHKSSHGKTIADVESALGEALPAHARPALRWSLTVAGIGFVLWLGPVVLLIACFGIDNVFSQISIFFSKMAVVTFGGAYAVLSYVAQQAVESYHWLKPGEMLDGLGMAETTPGPLIMVGAFRSPGALNPMLAATLGGLLTTWVAFVPCFIWIFLGAPFIEVLRGNKALSAALSTITAAVVGVILNLAVWFGLHTLFAEVQDLQYGILSLKLPMLASINWPSLVLTAAAALALFRFKLGVIPVLLGSAAIGIAYYAVNGQL